MSITTESAVAVSSQNAEFESIYTDARGERQHIPWEENRSDSPLINWLNVVASSIVRCGARVVVVGCGLGEHARILSQRGYEVTAFDCSPTAIAWARRIDPDDGVSYHVADLFDLPQRWHHRFDLVIEINTLQSMAADLREDAMRNIGQLISPHGHLLVICRGCESDVEITDGPPWPLAESELLKSASIAGLMLDGEISDFHDESSDPPIRRLRGLFRRA